MKCERDILVSVVVPAFNRPKLLEELIDSLWDQTLSPSLYEIIIVDNCSTSDELRSKVEEWQARSPCHMVFHRMPVNMGPAPARNAGAALARAEIIAFTDDDCRACREWLASGLEGFINGEQVGFVCGPVLNKPGQPTTFFSIGAPLPGETPMYPTANVFYRKKVLREVGGFDKGVWLGEWKGAKGIALESSDTDLAWRTKEQGYTCVFQPNATIFHEVKTVSPIKWIMVNSRHSLVPLLVRRHPGFRERIMWWGPFVLADNARFYLAVLGIALSIITRGSSLLLALPFAYWAAVVPGRVFSPTRLPIMAARIILLFARQAAICGFLLYGSIRARTLVM